MRTCTQLVKRTPGAEGRPLALRRRDSELVEAQEWDSLVAALHSGVRVLTLLPRDAVVAAVGVYGPSRGGEAVLEALAAAHSADELGEETSEGECDGEDDEDDAEDSDEDDEDGADNGESDRDESGDQSSDHGESNDASRDGSDYDADVQDDARGVDSGEPSKRPRLYALTDVPAKIEKELDAFVRYRIRLINKDRNAAAARPVTVQNDRKTVCHS